MAKGITSLTGFVKKLEALRSEVDGTLYFRGHSNREYEILPSALREAQLKQSEHLLLAHFSSEVPDLFEGIPGTFDRLVQAQHFGLPTRLLDVSSNPLVALFFSCWGHEDTKKTGEVLAFEIPINSEKFGNSDKVACLANLSRLTEDERSIIKGATAECVSILGGSEHAYNASAEKQQLARDFFNDKPEVKRLVQFIRDEKPYFENRVNFDDLWDIQPVIPSKRNARINAQSGAFLLFGLAEVFSEIWARNVEVHRIHINADSKSEILSALDAVGINENTAFPEPEKIASAICRKFMGP